MPKGWAQAIFCNRLHCATGIQSAAICPAAPVALVKSARLWIFRRWKEWLPQRPGRSVRGDMSNSLNTKHQPNRIAVIMAGGSGERFWPYSRRLRPKQLLSFGGRPPMLREAVRRIAPIIPPERVLVIAGGHLRQPILECLGADFPPENVIAEPEGRNTAPCLVLAAAVARRRWGNPTMAVLTADHIVEPEEVFLDQVRQACEAAERAGDLVIFGVPPTEPHTGYGYIETSAARPELGADALNVVQFREKPDLQTAREFVAAGTFFWNSGMFFWTSEAFCAAARQHQPAMARALDAIERAWDTPDATEVVARAFASMEKLPIDIAIMEKALNRLCIRARFHWEDIGAWTALDRLFAPDAEGNVLVGDVTVLDAHGSVIYAPGESSSPASDKTGAASPVGSFSPAAGASGAPKPKLVAALGVRDVIVVAVEDVILVASKDRAQDIKKLIARLRESGREDLM